MPVTTGHHSAATLEARLVVQGKVPAFAMQVVLSAATATGVDTATIDTTRTSVGTATAMSTSSTRLHGALSLHQVKQVPVALP